jgi:hypothetical protein
MVIVAAREENERKIAAEMPYKGILHDKFEVVEEKDTFMGK